MTLYSLTVQMQEILDMAESGEFDEELIANTLEGVEGEIEDKLDSYGVIVNELQDDVDKLDKEIKRLNAKKKTITGSIDYLKRMVMFTMGRMDKKKIKGERFTWSIVKNGGKAPVIYEDDFNPLNIPEQFQMWDVQPDKALIREVLESGTELPFARMGERGESLRL